MKSTMRCLWLVLSFTCLVHRAAAGTVLDSIVGISGTWSRTHSPYVAKTDVVIPETITVTVEPGVELRFNPRTTLKVKGTLLARGTASQRIVFTKNAGSAPGHVVPKNVRLVDGSEVRMGKLEVKYKDHWVGVCSRNREWSRKDSGVACRELGFADGNFTLLEVAENYTQHILLEQPRCTGLEGSILDCAGNVNISLGSDICHFQEVVSLQCWGINEAQYGSFWKGLEFYNTTLELRSLQTDNSKMNVSSSVLSYVDIQYAGVNSSRHHVGAISASPYPPVLNNVRLRWNAYDAINFTRIKGPVDITSSLITQNRGHGMNISTAVGHIRINGVTSTQNGGHGGDIHMLNYHWLEQEVELVHHGITLCGLGSIPYSPRFPLMVNCKLAKTFTASGVCSQRIQTGRVAGQLVTLSMLEAERDPQASATITLRDFRTKRVLAVWPIDQSPPRLYQGVSSDFAAGLEISMAWRKPPNLDRCNTFEPCIRVVLQASVGETKNPEVSVMNSNFSANVQRGLTVKSPWTFVRVLNSHFKRNEFEAGLLVVNGSGDVFVNNSRFLDNERTGLNITTAGGNRIVNASHFERTRGYALDVRNQLWLRSRYNAPKLPLISIVHQTDFVDNWYAMRFYNVCDTEQLVLVNVTRVRGSKRGGIEMVSCLNWGHGEVKESALKMTNFTIGFSTFINNAKYVVRVTPMVNMNGSILNSTFTGNGGSKLTGRTGEVVTGGGGVIYIHNTVNFVQRRLYARFRVAYFILDNQFERNTGSFVISAQLVLDSSVQRLGILYNRFRQNSIFKGPGNLNPRSSVHAVVILSSANAVCHRNEFANPNSHFEIGTHLEGASLRIDASRNFWGMAPATGGWAAKMKQVFGRIFSKIDRHTLAGIDYVPLLRNDELHKHFFTSEPAYRHPFLDRSVSPPIVGGPMDESKRNVILTAGTYRITRDIVVPSIGSLQMQPGVQLQLDDSVGLFIKGSLKVAGSIAQPITAGLSPSSERRPLANATDLEQLGVRLVGTGDPVNNTKGRLEIFMQGRWGTVCDRGFGSREARIVCNQLGLVAHPDDWKLPPLAAASDPSQDPSAPIWMATVRCAPWDLDLRECVADSPNEHSCSHDQDVRLRCHERGWAGLRLTTTRHPSVVRNFNVSRAGLLDFFRMEFTAALEVDFNIHEISHLNIQHSLSDAYRINFNAMWGVRTLASSILSNNLGSGLLLKSPFFQLSGCELNRNTRSGLSYDPHFTEMEAYKLRNFMTITSSLKFSQTSWKESIQTSGYEFIGVKPKTEREVKTYRVQLETSIEQRLIIQVLDFNPTYAEENVTFYDAPLTSLASEPRKWRIPEDLAMFPIVSSGQYVTIEFKINGTRSNRLTMIVESKDMRSVPGSQMIDFYPKTELIVQNSQMLHNSRGISIKHYNDPTDREGEIYIRRKIENITLSSLTVRFNKREAMHVPSVSRYARDLFAPSFSEIIEGSSRTAVINYTIANCTFDDNGAGLFSDHNHVEYSNNVWHYRISKNSFRRNTRGGLIFDLPFVSKRFDWRYEPGLDHVLMVEDNTFANNKLFEVTVTGYHAKITFTRNRFEDNQCRSHLCAFEGMEKDLSFVGNSFLRNTMCTAMLHMSIYSQSEVSEYALASISRNNFQSNACPADTTIPPPLNMAVLPTCYSVGVFGLQNVTVQYNLFSNNYRSELVAGILSSSIDNVMDCRNNWWGTTDVKAIRAKIFDVDDWNNFLLADFSGFLLGADFNAGRSSLTNTMVARTLDRDVVMRTGVLGGRVGADLSLQRRATPYRVVSDLTVPKGVTLKIEAGTVIEFGPNVGLLVFGRLIARGTSFRPIVMRPLMKPGQALRFRRAAKTPPSKKVRLVGGLQRDEGFLQFYNSTADRWDIVCDRQFSERVGRVVCRELGVDTYNVVVRSTHLYDHYIYGYDNPYIAKHFWMRTYTCRGDEQTRLRCTQRLNYDVRACAARRGYIFLRCGQSIIANASYGFWGNVRVASDKLEQTGALAAGEDASRLEHIHFRGAGVLHGERVAALETTYVYPRLDNIDMQASAWHGVDIIAPRGFVRVANSSFKNNLGRAFNILVLNGDSSSNERTPFLPLRQLSLPAHFVYGLIDMCDASKKIYVRDRVLVYYKYTDQTRACTKLFSSKTLSKQVAVRFLQLNLYEDPFTKNSIELFNGENFNVTELLVELTASKVKSEEAMRRSYMTTTSYSDMGIHVHASPAGPMFGFLAEVVTLPISPMTYPDLKEEMTHSVLDSEFINNANGAIGYGGVGERNPDLEVRTCRFLNNGLAVLNLTSAQTVDLQIQNARSFDFSNNYVFKNKGGFSSWLYASSGAHAIRGNITNNVFSQTSHDIVLHLAGNHFNTLRVKRNFIVNNNVEMRDIIRVSGVIMQSFERNYLYANTGNVMLNVSGIDTLSQPSKYEWNGFYKNTALNYTRKTTVFCDSSQQQFRNNYFRNMENNYEMATGNMTVDRVNRLEPGGTCPGKNEYCRVGWTLRRDLSQCVCYRRSPVDAKFNWWGEGDHFYAQSRIFDNSDDDYLVKVDWSNAYSSNSTVLEKAIYCPPTWSFSSKQCFWYIGAPVTYREARYFCEFETNAILADSRRLVSWLTWLIETWQNNYAWINRFVWVSRAWIFSDVPTPNECPVVRNHWIEGYPCTKLIPFICQKSPYGSATILHVVAIVAVSVVAGIFFITGIIFLIFWILKSRQRRLQRHHYKESNRRLTLSRSKASLANPNSAVNSGTLSGAGSSSLKGNSALLASQMLGGTLASTTVGGRRPDSSAHPGMVLADSVDRLDRAQVDELRSNRQTVTGSRSTLISRQPTGSIASLDAVDLIGAQKDVQQRRMPRAMYNPTEIPMEPHSNTAASRNRPTMTRPQPYKNRPHPSGAAAGAPLPDSSQGRPSVSSNYDDEFSSSGAPKPGYRGPAKRGGYFSLSGHGSTTDSEFDTDFDDTDSTVTKKLPLEGDSSLSGSRPPKYESRVPYARHRASGGGYLSSETDV